MEEVVEMIKRMKNKRIQRNLNNRGVTLVEVIVSLLIIMIVFIPLLGSFVTSAKTNAAAKTQMYANTLSENVMEAIKVLGIEGTAKQFYSPVTEFALSSGADLSYEEDLTGGYGASVTTDLEGVKHFISTRGTSPYTYLMKNASEGTTTYDVKITFSSEPYTSTATPSPEPTGTITPAPTGIATDLPNDYQFADMSAFNAKSTALINPKSIATDYDYLAKSYFIQLHESYYYDMWVAECEAVEQANAPIWDAYDAACEEALAAGNPLPPAPETTPIPTQMPTLDESAINARINKTTTIELTKVTVDLEGHTKYCINSNVNYQFDNLLSSGGTVEGICAAPTTATLSRNYAGYCDDVQYDELSSVFLMYTPFTSATDLSKEKIKIDNQITEDMDIYLVIQAETGTIFSSDLNVELNGYSNKLHLFSQARMNFTGTPASSSNATDLASRLLKDIGSDSARIYEVVVAVYESGSNFTNQLTSISSTIINE